MLLQMIPNCMFHSNLTKNANESAAITAMQNCIDDVKKWMFANKLKLNDGKTEFLLIGTRQQLAKVNSRTLRVGEITVTCSSVLKSGLLVRLTTEI